MPPVSQSQSLYPYLIGIGPAGCGHCKKMQPVFEQVAEHCRMAALMIYTELVMRHQGKPAPAPQTPPTRH